MTTAGNHPPTHAHVAALEADTGLRHELVDGELFAMSGGTPEHNLLAANTLIHLGMQLMGSPCRPVGSDQKVHVLTDHDDAGLYPDIAVYCGPRERSGAAPTALTNPTVLVEVLSGSTEAYDRGRKFELYRTLRTLRHYVLMAQDRCLIEVYDRNGDGTWTLRVARDGESLELSTIGATLVVDDLYDGVFEE